MKHCKVCNRDLPLSEFTKNKNYPDGYFNNCKECKNAYQRNYIHLNSYKIRQQKREAYKRTKPSERDRRLKYQFSITQEQYNQMLIEQDSKCAICGEAETAIIAGTTIVRKLSVDHDHKTKKIRALLCSRCNVAVGLLKEDPVRAKNLVDYLIKWK